jgi:hypothetical protein
MAIMEVPLPAFGQKPTISWAPSGRRVSVLEDVHAHSRPDHLLVVDPARRDSWRLPIADRQSEYVAVTWLSDSRLLVETSRSGVFRLAEVDTNTKRPVWSRDVGDQDYQAMTWSGAARRLAFMDERGFVSVIDLARPKLVRRTAITGTPKWSPDGTRLLGTHGSEQSPELATWPGGGRLDLPYLRSVLWMPEGHTLVGLQRLSGSTIGAEPGPHDQLVEIGPAGEDAHVIRSSWPAPPIAIESIDSAPS